MTSGFENNHFICGRKREDTRGTLEWNFINEMTTRHTSMWVYFWLICVIRKQMHSRSFNKITFELLVCVWHDNIIYKAKRIINTNVNFTLNHANIVYVVSWNKHIKCSKCIRNSNFHNKIFITSVLCTIDANILYN